MSTEKADQTESTLRGNEYIPAPEELRVIDVAIAAIDAGEIATDVEIQAAFAKVRSA